MYVDETYDVFKGEPVESAGFSVMCQRREGDFVEELTLYRLTEEVFPMMPETTQKLVKNAVCAQIEYLDANGGAEMDMGNGMSATLTASFHTLEHLWQRVHGTVHICAEGGKNLVADWSDLSRRELLMRPMPEKTVDSHSHPVSASQCG